MFAYTSINVANLKTSADFYDGLFAVMHIKPFVQNAQFKAYGTEESQPYFMITKSDSKVVPSENIIALQCGTPNIVRKVYKKAMELGATSLEEPEAREDGMYFMANIQDPDGHKISLYGRPKIAFEVPKLYRRGSLQFRDMSSVRSGMRILKFIDSYKPIKDSVILDFGCGVKLTQGLRQMDDPHKKYYGLDVYGEMIEYLDGALGDHKKYEFKKVPFRNEMYNTDGEIMTAKSKLPVGNIKADIMGMFSVITHMNPDDTFAILSLLTRYAKKDTRLVFSAFSNVDQKPDFIDDDPSRPLLRALYNRDFLVDIIGKAGWDIVNEGKPIKLTMNDNFVCKLK